MFCFLRSRWYFYQLIQTCLSHGFGLVSLSSFTGRAKSIGNIELKSAVRIYWNDKLQQQQQQQHNYC